MILIFVKSKDFFRLYGLTDCGFPSYQTKIEIKYSYKGQNCQLKTETNW